MPSDTPAGRWKSNSVPTASACSQSRIVDSPLGRRTREKMKPSSSWPGLSASRTVLPDAADTLTQKKDGVQVKIVTGDGDVVARHVCRQVGVGDESIGSGDELDRLDDAALGHVAEQASIFTRVSPAQKNRIILALKRRGHVVGFLGDGINDAWHSMPPTVGISVMSATDVARQAADIILVKPCGSQGYCTGNSRRPLCVRQHDEVLVEAT